MGVEAIPDLNWNMEQHTRAQLLAVFATVI